MLEGSAVELDVEVSAAGASEEDGGGSGLVGGVVGVGALLAGGVE